MKKLVNFRPSFWCASSLAAGILLGYAWVRGWYGVWVSALSVLLLVLILFLAFKKKFVKIFAVCLIFLLAGGAGMLLEKGRNDRRQAMENVTLTGYVSSESADQGEYWLVVLRDAEVFDGVSAKKLDGNVILYAGSEDFYIKTGDFLTVEADLRGVNIFRDGVDTYAYKNGTFYRAFNIRSILAGEGVITPREKIEAFIKSRIKANMDPANADIATALVLGSRVRMSSDDKEAFRRTGVAHIFSVSGLHIAFVVAVFSFLARRLKLNRFLVPVVVMLPVIFYGYVVGFAATATRAIVMAACAMLMNILGYRADMLSSMSLAAIVILLISPLYIFEGGFLMSFGAVFGVATVTDFLNRRAERRVNRRAKPMGKLSAKVYAFFRKILNNVSTSLGASLGVLPFAALFYGEVSIVGVIANVLIIPFINVAFVIILIGVLPLPFGNFLLFVPDKLIAATRHIASFLDFSFSSVGVPSLGIGAVALFLGLFILSQFVNLRPRPKAAAFAACIILSAALAFLSAAPANPKDAVRIFDVYPGTAVVASSSSGDTVIFMSFRDGKETDLIGRYLSENKAGETFVFAQNLRDFDAALACDFCLAHGINVIYTMNGFPLYEDYKILSDAGVAVEYLLDGGGGGVLFARESLMGFEGYLIEVSGRKIFLISEMYPPAMEPHGGYDIVYALKRPDLAREFFPGSIVVSAVYSNETNLLTAVQNGHFTFLVGNGTIVLVD